jgi:hypothetical protein
MRTRSGRKFLGNTAAGAATISNLTFAGEHLLASAGGTFTYAAFTASEAGDIHVTMSWDEAIAYEVAGQVRG